MARQLPLPLSFKPEHGFEEYYSGANNAEVVEHLRSIAQGGEEPLIFLWGDNGLGKTHLLHASCREAHKSGLTVGYMPLKSVGEFGCGVLEGLEELNLVCLDDLEPVLGKEDWEWALFDLFNRLRDSGHSLVITASSPPSELPIVLQDVKTRLGWGLTLCLRPLDDQDRMAALNLRARLLGLQLPEGVGRFLLNHYRRDLPSLIQLLGQLDDATLAAKRKLTIPFLKSYLAKKPCGS